MLAVLFCLPAWILAGPGAAWVARWRFLHRVPRATIVLWQAGALAALLWIAGAVLVAAHQAAEHAGAAPWPTRLGWGLAALFAGLVAVRLAWSLFRVAAASGARRRRHRELVDLLARPDRLLGTQGLRVLAEKIPLAYCLPGARGSRVVISEGMLAALDDAEVAAVLEHERAHVRARHDLVLDTFVALHRAFPLFIRSELPHAQCRLLVEMLADDAARRRVGPLPLARALVAMAAAPVPDAGLGVGQFSAARVERLGLEPGSRAWSAGVYALSLALVAAPVLAAGWATGLTVPF